MKMKKKLALLLAAVMTLSILSAPGLSASSVNTVNKVLENPPPKSLFVQDPAIEPDEVYATGDLDVEYIVGGSVLSIKMGINPDVDFLRVGDMIALTLSNNAEWFFAEGDGIRDFTGANTTYFDGTVDDTDNFYFIADSTTIDSGDNYVAYGELTAYRSGEPYYRIKIDRYDRSIATIIMYQTIESEETLLIPIIIRTNDDGGDITVTPIGGSITSNAVRIGRDPSSSRWVIADVESIKLGQDRIALDTISIEERVADTLQSGGYVQFKLTDGYQFETIPRLSADDGFIVSPSDQFVEGTNVFFSSDRNIMRLKVSFTKNWGTGILYFDDIVVKPNAETAATDYLGTSVRLSITDASDMPEFGIEAQTLTVGRFRADNIVEASLGAPLPVGIKKIGLSYIILEETSPNVLKPGGYLQLALPAGYQFETLPGLSASPDLTVENHQFEEGQNAFFNLARNVLTMRIGFSRTDENAASRLYIRDVFIVPNAETLATDYYGKNIELAIRDTKEYWVGKDGVDTLIQIPEEVPALGVQQLKLNIGSFTVPGTIGTNTTIASVRTGPSTIHLDRITIRETTRNILQSDGYAVLTIDEGYEWAVPMSASMTAGGGLTHVNDFDKKTPNYYFNRAKNELYVQFANLTPVNRAAYGAIYLEGLAVKPVGGATESIFGKTVSMSIQSAEGVKSVYPPDSDETAEPVTVNMTWSDVKTQTGIKIGTFMDYGISMVYDSEDAVTTQAYSGTKDIKAGTDGDETAIIIMSEITPRSWFAERGIEFTLTDAEGRRLDGLKFTNFKIVNARYIDLKKRTYDSIEDSDNQVTFGRQKIEVVGNNSNTYNLREMEIMVEFNASPSFAGDVYLSLTGSGTINSGPEPLKVAEITAPITVTTTSTQIMPGSQTYSAGDITVKESYPGALAEGKSVDFILDSNATFLPFAADSLTIISGDIELEPQTSQDNRYKATVSKASTVASTFVLKRVNVRGVSGGAIDLTVGGDACDWVETYEANAAMDSVMFPEEGVVFEDYLIEQVQNPTASHPVGEVTSGTQIKLATVTPGAKIYYTTDGTNPTRRSQEFSDAAPISITSATTIKAVALKAECRDSDVQTFSYTVKTSSSSGGSSSSGSSSGGGGGGGTAVTKYKVTFATDGGNAIATQSVSSGSTITKPTDPVKEGFVFTGWYTGAALTTAYDFSKKVTGNLTLYAGWAAASVPEQEVPEAPEADDPIPLAEPEPEATAVFGDISGHWAEEMINEIAALAIAGGYPDGTFKPDATVTRAEFIKMAVDALGFEDNSGARAFDDVSDSDWYKQYIDIGVSAGLAQGTSDALFSPNANITRQDLCVMMYNAMRNRGVEMPEPEAAAFADSAMIAGYAQTAVDTFKQLGIIGGRENNVFDPAASATRAEAVKIIVEALRFSGLI